ncbi:helix-turn-helix transcriptional regulator [Pseudomaricurvus alkylphenolicus]|uniref:winged helix-turn-helix transcriptional regulator n=1 Tax=Pseudomaricurvus alkylphenolicus TaxID=1306991 RepID=UPI00142417DE|nr:helix-turn-helix domain-containing protein [Pseudomaricurvus alkylphenolicus]NIB38727.1 helix-turn-helix transcriptional regulator [Pseudomaricurvus alkylphenolicus]
MPANNPVAPSPFTPLVENCSVDRTLQVLSDPWTSLVLRELWFGLHRFGEFQAVLQIPKATLTNRLKSLLDAGLLKQVPGRQGGLRKEYRFTEMGAELYPIMLTLLSWGDTWLSQEQGPPIKLFHRRNGDRLRVDVICSSCKTSVNSTNVAFEKGPGAGVSPLINHRSTNRSSKPENFTTPRACSVARTLRVLGDRWSFLLIRELFFGRHRFDPIQRQLNMSTSVLSNRIKQLVDHKIIEKSRYGKSTSRYEYYLTESGLDLYPSLLAMILWGDKWLPAKGGSPILLRHKTCGQLFEPVVVDQSKGLPLSAKEVRYAPGPGWSVNYGEDLLLNRLHILQ